MIDLNEIFPMTSSELEISHSVESYDKKKLQKIADYNDAEKRIGS